MFTESIILLKILALVILFVIAIIGGAVPMFWKSLRDSPIALSHLNAFSGGVFISMALNHLLPDANNSFIDIGFPFHTMSFTLAMLGYSLILFIEKCIVDAHSFVHTHDDNNNEEHHHGHHHNNSMHLHSHNHDHYQHNENNGDIIIPAFSKKSATSENDTIETNKNTINNLISPGSTNSANFNSLPFLQPDSPLLPSSHPSNRKRFVVKASLIPTEIESILSPTASTSLLNTSNTDYSKLNKDEIEVTTEKGSNKKPQSENDYLVASLVLMSALSVHSLLEGIALGLQDNTEHVFTLAIGLMAHKWVEAVALATSFIKSKRSLNVSALFMLFFSLATPVGVAIGIGLSFTQSELVEAIFTGIAAGTFLYVGCNEVVAEEFEERDYRLTKFLSLIIGMSLIAILTGVVTD